MSKLVPRKSPSITRNAGSKWFPRGREQAFVALVSDKGIAQNITYSIDQNAAISTSRPMDLAFISWHLRSMGYHVNHPYTLLWDVRASDLVEVVSRKVPRTIRRLSKGSGTEVSKIRRATCSCRTISGRGYVVYKMYRHDIEFECDCSGTVLLELREETAMPLFSLMRLYHSGEYICNMFRP